MSLEGQQLGDFEILERLGQGGMGAVYKARQISLDRFVALKTLQSGIADDVDYISRFRQEAKAAAALNHPNLVQVYYAGENEGFHWFAMEYVEGESAKTRLKRKGYVEAAEAIAIVLHVATALEYAWRKAQLIHRDIKPDNIFLSSDGEVKLGDLGLAKSAGQTTGLTMTGHSMGTPHYISPEQVQDMRMVDFRADIYSLGCTLFHLLSGTPPFDGSNAATVMVKHITEPVPVLKAVWAECPQGLSDVVERMMQKDPADRQPDYATLIGELREAFEALGTAEIPPVSEPVPEAPAAARAVPVTSPVAVATAPKVVARAIPASVRKSKMPLYAGITCALLAMAGLATFVLAPKKEGRNPATSPARDGAGNQVAAASPQAATKDSPFVNGLGMKFVPVPGTKVLFSVWDTRVQDYEAYAKANQVDDGWKQQDKDGVPLGRGADDPVIAVSWEDAHGFCQWLTAKEQAEGKLSKGVRYRLPKDEEWSVAVGLGPETGTTPAEKSGKNDADFPWGKDYPPTKIVGNYSDESYQAKFPSKESGTPHHWMAGYTDGDAGPSPVGIFSANAYGLYDMGGNVWQLCEDRYDASANVIALRGGSYADYGRPNLLSSARIHNSPKDRHNNTGFRCVLELPPR